MNHTELFSEYRTNLVNKLIREGILKTPALIEAMKQIPRHKFIPSEYNKHAYEDRPLQIGHGQTISAPHMNAMMCEILEIQPGDRILEVGTGSGYHGALLSKLTGFTGEVITIERHPSLAQHAKNIYHQLELTNISVKIGDGTLGDPENAPFDKILVTAAGPKAPEPLLTQLSDNQGILCIPLGKKTNVQALYKITKQDGKYDYTRITGVMFVPLIGKHGFKT